MDNEKDLNEDKIETLEADQFKQIDEKVKEMEDKYLRTLAEFENFKKRTIKERSDLLKYQGERIFLDLLEILDNFNLAMQHLEADPTTVKQGISMIFGNFQDFLNRWDVKAEDGVGNKFDPNKHNAISKIPNSGENAGLIISELKKTYFYKDKLLRPGDVIVADDK